MLIPKVKQHIVGSFSAADIVVPSLVKTTPSVPTSVALLPEAHSRSSEEVEAFFERVRTMLKSGSYGTDKNVHVHIAICECIDFGFDTRGRIFGACRQLGFKNGHAESILKVETGENPELHSWRRGVDGRYSTHA